MSQGPEASFSAQSVGAPGAVRTGYGRALLASAVWAVVNLVLIVVVSGPPPSPRDAGSLTFGLLAPTLLGALVTWLIARRRVGWPFWLVVLLALPFYAILRVFFSAAGS